MTGAGPSDDPYVAAGVDYGLLDAGKRAALSAAMATSDALHRFGGQAIDSTRGEPAFAFRLGEHTLAFVLEGLGTKSMIARAYRQTSGSNRFADVAYDTIAAILNDLCCVGALPLVVNAYFATGSSDWYADAEQVDALVAGWRRGCDDANCTWGGGESPSLAGLVAEGEIELAGSAIGLVPEGAAVLSSDSVQAGNELVFIESSGLHANGASLARSIAANLPDGYRTVLPSGREYGDALLDPSILYVKLTRELLRLSAPVNYLSHVTGHGLLKVMRPAKQQSYRIRSLPDVPEVLAFLASQAGMDAASAYRTLNMGVGFVVYCDEGCGSQVVQAADDLGYRALIAGVVEKGPRQVILEPIGVTYQGDQLDFTPDAGSRAR